MNYEKCCCAHCGQNIEYPSEGNGQTIPCPTCEQLVTLMPDNPPADLSSIVIPAALATVAPAPIQKPKQQKRARTTFSKLTEETIRTKTKTGDTPLHRAAKSGRICEIPRHLLKTELFMSTNNSFSRETPIHIAARYGHLDKVPKEFLTKETLTASTEYEKKESRTEPTPPRTETPLHTAVRYGYADQIPNEFLTPEFLSMEASGYRLTVLHQLAYAKRLDLIPDTYATSEMWNLRNSSGQTPREVLESIIQREDYVAAVRVEPATEKQKEKLRYFGCTWDEGITKGQASDAIDECVRQFPQRDSDYYNRPATDEQMAELTPILKAQDEEPDDYADEGKPLTYGQAKDLLRDIYLEKRQKMEEEFFITQSTPLSEREDHDCPPTAAQVKSLEGGLKLDRQAAISAAKLDELLKLEGLPPRSEDMELFALHGIKFHTGDAFAAYGIGDLVRCFEKMAAQAGDGCTNISIACVAASSDPAFQKATITLDQFNRLVFTWPQHKLSEWYRKGTKY